MTEGTRKPYPSDLSDAQWNLIESLIPPKIGKGEDRKVNLREVMNGILYVLRTGCQWDYLPHDLLPKGTTYYYFDKWKKDGTLDHLLTVHVDETGSKENGLKRWIWCFRAGRFSLLFNRRGSKSVNAYRNRYLTYSRRFPIITNGKLAGEPTV